MTQQILFSSRIGSRRSFAVEFEAFNELPRMWNEWWGSLWLWADGHILGRPFEIEMVMSGLDPLLDAIYLAEQNTENQTSAILASLPASQALEWVMWAQCGENNPPKGFHGNEKLLAAHEVLPRGSPFFDNWRAILIPEDLAERFVFRYKEDDVIEARWPKGTFRKVVLQAQEEFSKLAKAHMTPPTLV